jgi:hypothetical protein
MSPDLIKYEYRGTNVVIGRSPNYNLWRASLNGVTIPNAFFKTPYLADTHCKAIIDARENNRHE